MTTNTRFKIVFNDNNNPRTSSLQQIIHHNVNSLNSPLKKSDKKLSWSQRQQLIALQNQILLRKRKQQSYLLKSRAENISLNNNPLEQTNSPNSNSNSNNISQQDIKNNEEKVAPVPEKDWNTNNWDDDVCLNTDSDYDD